MKRWIELTHKITFFIFFAATVFAQQPAENLIAEFGQLETFVQEPAKIDNIVIQAPVDMSGPSANHSCEYRRDRVYSCFLPVEIKHKRNDNCPDATAASLGRQVWCHYYRKLPFIITNNWQWEYAQKFSECEYFQYDLEDHGGWWEIIIEGVCSKTEGSVKGSWLEYGTVAQPESTVCPLMSSIDVISFSSMRVRNGYPKTNRTL